MSIRIKITPERLRDIADILENQATDERYKPYPNDNSGEKEYLAHLDDVEGKLVILTYVPNLS